MAQLKTGHEERERERVRESEREREREREKQGSEDGAMNLKILHQARQTL